MRAPRKLRTGEAPGLSLPHTHDNLRAMLTRILIFLALLAHTSTAEDWPQWRGPRNDGRSTEAAFRVGSDRSPL